MNASVSVYVINSIESVRFCSGNHKTIKYRLQRDDFVGVDVIAYWKSDLKISERAGLLAVTVFSWHTLYFDEMQIAISRSLFLICAAFLSHVISRCILCVDD